VLGALIFSFAFVAFLRTVFGFEPLWEPQVYITVAGLLCGIAFLIGIGCFDFWWDWMRGRKLDHEDHSLHGATSWRDYFRVNTDHKVIGIQYLVTTFFFFLVGGALAELVRVELAAPGQTIADGETYNGFFSAHATLMIFVFAVPVFAGLANYILPLMIGAKDMAFPRLNALSFWMLPVAGMCFMASFVWGFFDAGWTAYPPFASQGGTGQTLFELGVQFAGASSIATAVNFLVTIFTMRAPGMTLWRMPLLVWANMVTSFLVVLATPFIAGSQFMVMFDRVMGTQFFVPEGGGDVIMYQHVFWFYSHPAVYIMILPGFGIISEVIATFARKPIFGYRAIAFSTVAIAVLGFGVWAHHMFVSGMAPWLRVPMMITTVIIAVPTGVKVWSWLATLWQGRIHLRTPMLFALGFLFTFVIGGLSGVFLGSVPLDIHVSDTYFIVAHIHYVFFGGSVFTVFAGVYYWFPKMTGRMYDERLGQWHFWLTFIASNVTFFPMHWLGLQGMPRRVADYDERFADLNLFISIAGFVLGAATLIFIYNMVVSWRSGPKAPWNPWRGKTLEWQVSSPPSLFNFETTPQVVGGPYQYGVEGARHAVVFAPEEVGGELTETTRHPILVIANETLTSRSLITALRERDQVGWWRYVLVAPAGPGGRRAAERRVELAVSVLQEAGISATGRVVDGGPVEAAREVAGEEDVYGVYVATFPIGRSRWLAQDAVDRIRKAVDVDVMQVTVPVEEARDAVNQTLLERVLGLVADPADPEALREAVVTRADRGPARFLIVGALDLPHPRWGDEANLLRGLGVEELKRVIDGLQDEGIPAEGEVADDDARRALADAVADARPAQVLIVTSGRAGTDELVRELRAAAADVPAEHVSLDAAAGAGR
jgi:cytochrome c oxidase subunit 1